MIAGDGGVNNDAVHQYQGHYQEQEEMRSSQLRDQLDNHSFPNSRHKGTNKKSGKQNGKENGRHKLPLCFQDGFGIERRACSHAWQPGWKKTGSIKRWQLRSPAGKR